MIPLCADKLEAVYDRYNRREYVSPDPLQFLYSYKDVADREVVGLIASGLAYGRVAQILKSVEKVLGRMDRPAEFVRQRSEKEMRQLFKDFKHRFTTGEEMVRMLMGAKGALERFGSLEACFLDGDDPKEETLDRSAREFVRRLMEPFAEKRNSLLPVPHGKGAFKRIHLYLRWMIRNDAVDPGGWDKISPCRLIVPLDTHMHRMGLSLGFTRRNQADIRTACEITAGFRRFSPDDAVKYDFALTRMGIRSDTAIGQMLGI
jgi:uncharacterized protein (TIGR02757 family)